MPLDVLPSSWCSWSEWGRCSVRPCHSGVHPPIQYETNSANNTIIYCLDPVEPSGIHSVSVLAADGRKTRIKPQKQRRRTCNCKYYNILRAIFSRCGKQNLVEIACKSCSVQDPVFNGEFPLQRLCSDVSEVSSSINVYHIIGGSLGVVAFVLLCVFFARFAVTESGRLSRRQRRRRTTVPPVDGSCLTPPELSSFAVELPPNYKDVIPLAPICKANDFGVQSDDQNPPPTYQEVIAVSPTAADMHRSIVRAQRADSGVI